MAGDLISPKKLQDANVEELTVFMTRFDEITSQLWSEDHQEAAPEGTGSDELSSSEAALRLFSKSENVFLLKEDGTLAKNTIEDEVVLANYASSGRLFARDDNNQLRQLQFIKDRAAGTTVEENKEATYLFLSEPVVPQAANGIAWWKYILAIFSSYYRDEIQAYNDAEKFDNQLKQWGFRDPTAKDENLSKDLQQFEDRLKEYSELQNTFTSASLKKDRSHKSLISAMHNTIRRNFSKEILNRIKDNPEQKAEILAQNAATFETKLNEMKEYLTTLYDPAELDKLVKIGPDARSAEKDVLGLKFDFIAETALENYDNYVKSGRSDTFQPRRYNQSFKKIVLSGTEEKKEPTQQVAPVEPVQQAVVTNPKDMNLAQFKAHLGTAYSNGSNVDIKKVLDSKNCSAEIYFDAMARKIEAQVARTMMTTLNNAPNPEEALKQQTALYVPLVADLKTFIISNTDVETLNRYCTGPRNPEDALKLQQSADDLVKNGVSRYLEETAKKNAEKEKAKSADAPQKQETSVEKTQSQPEKQGGQLGLH